LRDKANIFSDEVNATNQFVTATAVFSDCSAKSCTAVSSSSLISPTHNALIQSVFRASIHYAPVSVMFSDPPDYLFHSGLGVTARILPAVVAGRAVSGPVVCASVKDGWSFQHFIQDLLYALDANRALLSPGVKLAIPRPDARFPEADLRAVLRLIGITNELLLVDFGDYLHVNDGPVTVLDWTANVSRSEVMPIRRCCIQKLRASVSASVYALGEPRPRAAFIVICRPADKGRAWGNEAAVLEALAARADEEALQFVRFAPHETGEPSSLENRLRLFSTASVVVFVHDGAGYHIMACAAGTRIVEVTVPDSFSMDFWIEACDFRFVRLPAHNGNHNLPVYVDPEYLIHALDSTQLLM